MAVESFEVFTGYAGFMPVYHTIYYNVPEVKNKKVIPYCPRTTSPNLKAQNYVFKKPHLNRKRSEAYEGAGKNFRD